MDEDLKPLSEKQIKDKLKDFSGWIYQTNKITKEFTFDSFNAALEFLLKLAPFCNKIDHHPDIHIYYKKIVFDLTRFSVGGKVTDRDFKVASEIENLYSSFAS
jgi:4a-hydroxytetrahydrobiopterin dehydratase